MAQGLNPSRAPRTMVSTGRERFFIDSSPINGTCINSGISVFWSTAEESVVDELLSESDVSRAKTGLTWKSRRNKIKNKSIFLTTGIYSNILLFCKRYHNLLFRDYFK